ncbi:MAG: hypothetical protein M3R59_02080 [Verrucomicrobiota bacterium]|nr:hypothetical protein [Verrucomicrobiota bacterium]
MKIKNHYAETASSLAVVMVVMATLMVTVGVAVEYTTTINRNVQRSNQLLNADAIADGTLQLEFGYWREVCRSQTNVVMPTHNNLNPSVSLDAIPTPSPGTFPGVVNFTVKRGTSLDPNASADSDSTFLISNYKVVAVDPQMNPMATATATPPRQTGTSSTDITYNYVASADVTVPTLHGNVTTKYRRNFQKQQQSPWNYAIFYVDPLEIHPGPAFTVTGWVNTNSNLYTGHNTLTFADKVTYGGDWKIGFMPGDPSHAGETPAAPHYPSNLPPAQANAQQPFGMDSTRLFSPTDSNPNNDSYHELIEPAISGYPDPLAGMRYSQQAQFTINVDASNNVTVYNGTNRINPPVSGKDNRSTNDKQNYNAIMSAVTTGGSLQDGRQGVIMQLTTLDVSKIVTALAAEVSNPNNKSTTAAQLNNWNGIIYVTGTAPSGKQPGLEIINGASLPTGGLTIASQYSVYVKGDYNTGGTPPSNTGDPTTPQVNGYTRQPSAVIGDAVTILSNAWIDANSGNSLSSRSASNTTVNTAIISGNIQTTSAAYSGGAENFPRFLEDWTNKSFTYYGSMVEMYQSKTATGPWVYGGNVYNAPIRQWYFDTNFKTNPPPGSLMIYNYVNGRWYTS